MKKTTKAQMFSVDRKEFLMEPVKAVVKRWAWNWGRDCRSSRRAVGPAL
ncbi:MAG: hypothetical protein ACLRNQ_02405 [Flavonifractor plautii]